MCAAVERKQGGPETVVVFGCGEEAGNGTYHLTGESMRHEKPNPRYEMQGILDGKTVRCQLVKCSDRIDNGAWILDIGDKVKFHSIAPPNSNPHLPPCRGWWNESCTRPPIVLNGDENIIDWRQDPGYSLADYKIDVMYEQNGSSITTTYHCHRVILVNSSAHFTSLLKGNAKDGCSFSELKENTSIELNSVVAAVFPHFLDYIYSRFSDTARSCQHDLIQIDFGFLWFANYFGMSKLKSDLDLVLAAKLNLSTSAEFLGYALELGLQHIVDAVISLCSENLFQLNDIEKEDEDWYFETLAEVFDADCLLSVLTKKNADVAISRNASKLVAAFCGLHNIDVETFQALTCDTLLPDIDSGAALQLLEKERVLIIAAPDTLISNLQERCIDALARDFIHLNTVEESFLQRQTAALLARLIVKTRETLKDSMEDWKSDFDWQMFQRAL
jgi:hypothetical protein